MLFRVGPKSVVLVSFLALAVPAFAARPYHVDDEVMPRILGAREQLVIERIPLLNGDPGRLELERFEVWRKDAEIIAYGDKGKETSLSVPRTRYYKGRVAGDPLSMAFLSVRTDGSVVGMVTTRDKVFNIGGDNRTPLAVAEYDPLDDDTGVTGFTCDLEKAQIVGLSESKKMAMVPVADANAAPSVSIAYGLNIAVETDNELYVAFGSNSTALTNYIGDLVAKTSIIYQRDLKTTLTLGTFHIWTTAADPWNAGSPGAGLDELGNYWHANYLGVNRSAVVMVSGKLFSGGIAWRSTNLLCANDFLNGASYAGPYAFCSSSGAVTTTVPNPNDTNGGIAYRLPSNNNFWILLEFAHELGHVVNSQHTHCMALTPAEKVQYNIGTPGGAPDRNYVDQCYGGEAGCYSGSVSAPPELGTIMSYCHNVSPTPTRSRYVFWLPNEASEKVVPPMTLALENGSPNGAITTGTAPLACSAGRTASISAATTMAWSITGGVITSATNTSSITFTPTSPNVVLTVTAANAKGCSITSQRTIATLCTPIGAPANVVATGISTSEVDISWSAVTGAVNYEVSRSSNGSTFSPIGTTTNTTYPDTTPAALGAYIYKVRSIDAAANMSGYSAGDLATAVSFTDGTLIAGTTPVAAAHFVELRNAVNAVRVLAGLTPSSFTDPALNGSVLVKGVHLTELRAALDPARSALGLPAISYTDGTLTPLATDIKTAHITELRGGVN
jgi:hypothetical protein